jgi:dolichol kinase
MDNETVLRRVAHLLIALAPLYYVLPVNLPLVGIHRWTVVVVFFVAILVFEGYRLWKGMTFLGLRPHEKNQIASFAWAAAGITAVWLSPHDIASAALVGMALVDPLAGELRSAGVHVRKRTAASLVAYFAICLGILLAWDVRPVIELLLLSSVATVLAVASEGVKTRYVDDDFLMSVVPAAAMSGLALLM